MSTCVDLDCIQVLVTLLETEGTTRAEMAFRHHPSEPWSEPIDLADPESNQAR